MNLLSILSFFTKVDTALPVVQQTAHALLATTSTIAKVTGNDNAASHIDTLAQKAAVDVDIAHAVLALSGSLIGMIAQGIEQAKTSQEVQNSTTPLNSGGIGGGAG